MLAGTWPGVIVMTYLLVLRRESLALTHAHSFCVSGKLDEGTLFYNLFKFCF